ncbi:hypothetical protein [Psychrobacter sp. HII-4]|uniref:hypothetical protein n=1 Tax=Psychrobacter sp. HII-4 TaxID=1569264 RepID=UPI0019190D7B|nr:hypothetical protein [Psychrobacter sp. HII-4]
MNQSYRVRLLNIMIGLFATSGLIACANDITEGMAHSQNKSHSAVGEDVNSISKADESAIAKGQYPVASVLIKLMEDMDLTFVSVDPEDAHELRLKTVKTGDTELDGKTAKYAQVQNIYKLGDAPNIYFPKQYYYSLNPLQLYLYVVNEDLDVQTMVGQSIPVPKCAKVGTSQNHIPKATYNNIFDNIKSSWSLSKATSNTAWLCDTFEYSDQSSGADAFLKACYEINQAGDILDGKINMPSMLEAKNIDLILKK